MTVLELISRFKRSQYIDIVDLRDENRGYVYSSDILRCPPDWNEREVHHLSIHAVPHRAPRLIIFLE